MTAADAVADVRDGATLIFGGFGVMHGWPTRCLEALRARGVRDLTLIYNTPGLGPTSSQLLIENGQVRRLVCSLAVNTTRTSPAELAIRAGTLAVELVPQGVLAERIRAGAAGLAAFWSPVGVGTPVAAGKEQRDFAGRRHVLETALRADVSFLRALRADSCGNLMYRGAGRNFHPACAAAAPITIAEVDTLVPAGGIDPELVVTPGIQVDRLVLSGEAAVRERALSLTRQHGRKIAMEARPDGGLPPDLMARRAALLLRDGEYVNLGLGLPALVANAVEGLRDVVLHAENGLLGYGPVADESVADVDYYDASGRFVQLHPGAVTCDTTTAFAMARGGRVSTVILGAFEVSATGDLANWSVPATGKGGIGGAMDLVAGGARVIVLTFHATREGRPKLVARCAYPLTAAGCVTDVVTDLAYLTLDRDGFLLRELAPGVSIDQVRAATAAPLRVASDLREMVFVN